MNQYITGAIIKELREKNRMTQGHCSEFKYIRQYA